MGAPTNTGGKGLAGRPIVRRTGKPARRTPDAIVAARRLTESETLDALRLTDEQIAFLDKCARGYPPRNALAAITAIKLKLDFSQRKPKQDIDVTARVTLEQLVVESLKPSEGEG